MKYLKTINELFWTKKKDDDIAQKILDLLNSEKGIIVEKKTEKGIIGGRFITDDHNIFKITIDEFDIEAKFNSSSILLDKTKLDCSSSFFKKIYEKLKELYNKKDFKDGFNRVRDRFLRDTKTNELFK